MPTIAEIRQQFPQYGDMSDDALAGALHQKFYSDMSRADFDAKIGLGKAQEKKADKETYNTADVAKSAGIGAVKGGVGLAGLPGDIRELAASGASAITGVPAEKFSGAIKYIPMLGGPTSDQIRSGIEGVTGKFYEPKTTAGEYAQTAGEFLPAAIGPGGLVARAGRVLVPAAATETAGQLTDQNPYARAAAGFASPVAMTGARRLITPMQAPNAGRQAMINTLEQEGVQPTAGQRSGSKALGYIESTLGDYPMAGGQATAATNAAGEQFTRAALRRIGHQGNDITPAAVDRAVTEVQNEFQRLSSTNVLHFDPQMGQDIGQTLNRYARKLPSQQREVVNDIVNDIVGHGRSMPGDTYQIARSDLSRMAHAARNSDPTYSAALRGLRDALDNAMRRSISPQDRAAWDQARQRWGNWRTIENAAKNTDAAGNVSITPQQLVQAAAARDRGGFARGMGDFNDLARAGQAIMRPLPQSGTTPRAIAAGLLPALLSPAGWIPAMAGLAGPPLAGRAIMSGLGQRYLSNQLMQPAPGLGQRAITGGLLGGLLTGP